MIGDGELEIKEAETQWVYSTVGESGKNQGISLPAYTFSASPPGRFHEWGTAIRMLRDHYTRGAGRKHYRQRGAAHRVPWRCPSPNPPHEDFLPDDQSAWTMETL